VKRDRAIAARVTTHQVVGDKTTTSPGAVRRKASESEIQMQDLPDLLTGRMADQWTVSAEAARNRSI
jgi:hypothetical protein